MLVAIAALSTAPLATVAQRLREAALPYLGSSALVIFTEDCTGRPQKKAGDEAIISRVSIAELDHIRAAFSDGGRSGGGGAGTGSWLGEAALGGEEHRVLALSSPSNALLVLAEPQPLPDPAHHAAAERVLHYLWALAAERIREKVADAPPSYLIESRAASAERIRARQVADVSDWKLGERELEVLQLLAAGQRNRAIAAKLHISENTVKFHLRNIYRKVGATSRTEAIAMAHSKGLR